MKILNIFNLKGLWLAAFISLLCTTAIALPYYWVGPTGAQVWNDPQNWSLTSGGSGGAGVPGSTDDAIFDSNGTGDCVVDIADLVVGSLSFNTGFSGLIDLGGDTLRTQSIVNLQTPMQNGVVRVLGGGIQIQTSVLAIALIGITDDLNLLSNTIQNVTLITTGTVLNSVTGNIFTAATSFTRAGPGVLYFDSNSYQDVTIRNQNNTGEVTCQGTETYGSTATFINDATSFMQLAHVGGLTTYTGVVTFSNVQNGTISVGLGGGTATLEALASLEIIDTSTGTVSLNNLTFNGTYNPFSAVLTGTTHLHLANCTFNSPFFQILPRITSGTGNQFNKRFKVSLTGTSASTVSGAFAKRADITRTGDGNLSVLSGNFLDSAFVQNNALIGSLQLSDNTFNKVFFTRMNGILQPCASGTSIFRDNITLNTGTVGGDFFIGTSPTEGVMRLEGGIDQNINGSGTANIIIHRLELDKSAGVVRVNTPLSVATSLAFTQGIIRTTDIDFIRFLDGATASGASALSHIEGPVRKLGNDNFIFPVGDGGTFRPVAISAPASTTDEFTARFLRTTHPFGGPATYAIPLITVSTCEYWTLDRTAGSSDVFVTLGWETADCPAPYITDPTSLQVARWNGTQWVTHGQGSFTGSSAAGTVTSAAAVSSFSPFVLGSTSLSNPLPIRLIHFSAQMLNESVVLTWRSASELNSDFYEVQRSITGTEFEALGRVAAEGNSNTAKDYKYIDIEPVNKTSYYRLKMVDLDGSAEFSKVVLVTYNGNLHIYPNPVAEVVHLTEKRSVRISDLMGVTHLESSGPVREIIIPDYLTEGNYILQTDRGEYFRIVIVRQ